MKFICEFFLRIDVTFRDESNESSSTMIGCSDATVTTPNHLLFMRSKILLATPHATVP